MSREAERRIRRRAVREAIGLPGIVLGASYLGFGSVVRSSGLEMWHGVVSTITAWALPGQIVLVELYAIGGSLVAMAAGVALTNARLLPMTLSLMPQLRHDRLARWRLYLYAHLVAVTGWSFAMRRNPDLAVELRAPYFVTFATTIWLISIACTVLGFFLAGLVPTPVALGLVFLNPLYFLLLFLADARTLTRGLALGFGMLLGPPLHLVSPDWGLLAAGTIAGTAAFALPRLLPTTGAR